MAPPYFVEVLRVALERYDHLAAPRVMSFGANVEVKLTGAESYRPQREGTLALGWTGWLTPS